MKQAEQGVSCHQPRTPPSSPGAGGAQLLPWPRGVGSVDTITIARHFHTVPVEQEGGTVCTQASLGLFRKPKSLLSLDSRSPRA